MAARRGRSQARRSGGGSNGLPGWAWLVIGVLLAIVVVLAAPKFMGAKDGESGFFRIGAPHANPDAQPQGSEQTDEAFEPVAAKKPGEAAAKPPAQADKGREFDFYELLPGEEVAMTDAQIAAIAREEARRKAAEAAAGMDAAQQAADAQARASAAATGLPQPLPETVGAPPPAPRPTQVASAAAPKPAAAVGVAATASTPTTVTPPAAATPYLLQAGAFQASGDAEAIKAKIALIGLNARVESATINGKTLYRVRMGPYASASDLAEAKSKLTSGGLPAVAIKAK